MNLPQKAPKSQGGEHHTTPEFLQDAIVADLADLFEGQTLPSSAGDRQPIRVYSQGHSDH